MFILNNLVIDVIFWSLFRDMTSLWVNFLPNAAFYYSSNSVWQNQPKSKQNEGPMLCPPHREPLHSKREREWDRDRVLNVLSQAWVCSPSSDSGVSSKNNHLPEVEQFRSVYPAKVLNNKCWWSKKGVLLWLCLYKACFTVSSCTATV